MNSYDGELETRDHGWEGVEDARSRAPEGMPSDLLGFVGLREAITWVPEREHGQLVLRPGVRDFCLTARAALLAIAREDAGTADSL